MREGYLTRTDLAELMDVSVSRVGNLDLEGMLPCKSEDLMIFDAYGRPRRIKIYPEKPIMTWIENGGHRLDYQVYKKNKKKVVTEGITFKQVFAGAFATKAEKDLKELKLMNARVSNPIRTRTRVLGEWCKGEVKKSRG